MPLTYEQRVKNGEFICPSCDDYWFETPPELLARADTVKQASAGKRRKKFYGVRKGARPGIYSTWEECEEVVKYFSGAEFMGFDTYEKAAKYLEE